MRAQLTRVSHAQPASHLIFPFFQDTIFEEHLILLRGSSIELVCELFQEAKGGSGSKDKDMKKTVGSQFQQSLSYVAAQHVRCSNAGEPNLDVS